MPSPTHVLKIPASASAKKARALGLEVGQTYLGRLDGENFVTGVGAGRRIVSPQDRDCVSAKVLRYRDVPAPPAKVRARVKSLALVWD